MSETVITSTRSQCFLVLDHLSVFRFFRLWFLNFKSFCLHEMLVRQLKALNTYIHFPRFVDHNFIE